jgi:hypothetical protein
VAQQFKFANAAFYLAVAHRAIASGKGRIAMTRVAGQFHNMTGHVGEPTHQEAGIGDKRRIGDADKPVGARQKVLGLATAFGGAEHAQEHAFGPRPGHAPQGAPWFADPPKEGQGSRPAQDASQGVSNDFEDLHMVVRIDNGGGHADQVDEATELGVEFRFHFSKLNAAQP